MFVVLDTNVLLLPYVTGKASLQQISTIYKRLIRQKRLVIPGQVAREFAKNRGKNISELFQQISRKRNNTASLRTADYPLLESLKEYKAMLKLEEDINEIFYDYRKAIAQLLEQISLWQWNDPVSKLYKELFSKNVVLDIELDKKEVQKDLARRIEQKIPPGYKDAAKPDSGIGDLLIWYTILSIAEKHKKSAIFVSGEEKADWQIRSEGQTLYPRYELIDEYRQKSQGASFYILTFSIFLDLFGVSESVVAEVREKETKQVEFSSLSAFDPMGVFRVLFLWLASNYPDQVVKEVDPQGDQGVDFEIVYSDGSKMGVDAKIISPVTESQLNLLVETESALVKSKKYKHIIIAVIARNDVQLKYMDKLLGSKRVKPTAEVSLLMGYIRDQNKFEPVYFE